MAREGYTATVDRSALRTRASRPSYPTEKAAGVRLHLGTAYQ